MAISRDDWLKHARFNTIYLKNLTAKIHYCSESAIILSRTIGIEQKSDESDYCEKNTYGSVEEF